MSDIKIPDEIASWMVERGWGEHHDQWHFERRWDYWHALEQNPNTPDDWKEWIRGKFEEAASKDWKRPEIQEGETGNGEDFLFMHRAMIELILENFPNHFHYFRGWHTPPTDYLSPLDPVQVPEPEPERECHPNRKQICRAMLGAIARIESNHDSFSGDDEFGLFIQTNMRPTPTDPTAQSGDPQTGLHNYLHGRWSGLSTDIDLGDPRVNIYNTRFWRLHGWIDYQWWRLRQNRGLSNADQTYQSKLKFYKAMMDSQVHHHTFANVLKASKILPSRNAFVDLLAEIN